MAKRYCALMLALLLLCSLAACTRPGEGRSNASDDSLHLLASTYPVYLFLCEVTQGAQNVEVTALINQQISCLHDYTVSMQDMKALEAADALFLNGAGLDDFLNASLQSVKPQTKVYRLDRGIATLELLEGDHVRDDGHAHEVDPHYWLDPLRAAQMMDTMATDLMELDSENAALYRENADKAIATLQAAHTDWSARLATLPIRSMITFHNGFAYFAESFDLHIILSVEEAENQAASAQVIAQTLSLLAEFSLPAIFTEAYSSDASARAIAAESNVSVYPLSLLMSGDTEQAGLSLYLAAMERNIETLLEAYT